MTDPLEAARFDLVSSLRMTGHKIGIAAADRIEALEAENAALEFDVAALDELNMECEAHLDAICPPGVLTVWDRRGGTNRQLKLVETYVDWDHNYIDAATDEIVPYDDASLRQALYRLEPQ